MSNQKFAPDEVVAVIRGPYDDIVEFHIEDGVTTIPDRFFSYHKSLKTVYIPESVTRIGSEIFWRPGRGSDVDIYYAGDSVSWRKMTENITEYRWVYYAGAYDRYPYYNDTGSEYKWEPQKIYFSSGADAIRVHCQKDGVTIGYGESAK